MNGWVETATPDRVVSRRLEAWGGAEFVSVSVHRFSGGESWIRYVVIPRPARPVFRKVFDEWVAPATSEAGYSPTGRAFWREAWVRRCRRFVVIQQAGGLDV